MTHFLFPDENPPMYPSKPDVPTACIWLLAVMDPGDKSMKFVASILTSYLERGYLTEKQTAATRDVIKRQVKKFVDGDLMCQGAKPAEVQTMEFGTVVPMRRIEADDVQVIE